jgi:hypothetical protein
MPGAVTGARLFDFAPIDVPGRKTCRASDRADADCLSNVWQSFTRRMENFRSIRQS